MIVNGRVTGEAARVLAEFAYRLPVLEPVTLHSVDPHRLNPLHEYPRDTGMDVPHLRTMDFADYQFKVDAKGPDGLAEATLTMRANKYTAAKQDRTVWRAKVSHPTLFWEQYCDEALEAVFRRAYRR
jgi:hypothetical protein